MKRKLRYSSILVLLSLLSIHAFGQSVAGVMSAEQLLKDCTSKSSIDELSCVAYIGGFVDGIMIGQVLADHPITKGVCYSSEGIPSTQARNIIVNWIEAHPSNLHDQARIQATLALKDAFPCKK